MAVHGVCSKKDEDYETEAQSDAERVAKPTDSPGVGNKRKIK